MILRRLAQHLKEQNWTAITIEFVLLVLGVFLGIQVANWNEERQTRVRAESYTAHLKADLRHESWRYQFLLEYHRDVRAAAERAVAALAGGVALSDEDFLISAYRASQYKQNASRRSTFDELVSTGNIGLILDRELRRQVVALYNLTTIDHLVREGVESRYREHFRMSVPTDVQRALGQHCGDKYLRSGDYTDFDKVLDYSCQTGLPADVITAAAEVLRTDPQTIRLLRLRIADLDTRLVDLTSNNREVYEFLLDATKDPP
jgi:hypothetical protein